MLNHSCRAASRLHARFEPLAGRARTPCAIYARAANDRTRIQCLRIVAFRTKTRHPFASRALHQSWIVAPHRTLMSLPFEAPTNPHDPRAVRILAKSIYRELRGSGFSEQDVMALASELLSLVTSDVKRDKAR